MDPVSAPLCLRITGGVHPILCCPLCYPHPTYYIRRSTTIMRLLLE